MANAMGGMRGGIQGGKKAKAPKKTLKRLLAYSFSHYKVAMVFVILGVIISASANAAGSARAEYSMRIGTKLFFT